MDSFLINILASIISSFLAVALLSFFSKSAKKALTVMTSSLLGIDVEQVFPDSRDAFKDMQYEFKRSRKLLLIAGRGLELQRDLFRSFFEGNRTTFLILLQDPFLKDVQFDWIEAREEELAKFDKAYGKGLLRSQLKQAARFLLKACGNPSVQCRLFSAPLMGRAIITENVAYFHPYRPDSHGIDTPVIKYRRSGEMYDCLLNFFFIVWDRSKDILEISELEFAK